MEKFENEKTSETKGKTMLKRKYRNPFPRRLRFHLRILASLLALAMLLAAGDFGMLESTEGQSTGNCDISYRLTTQWNVGFQAEVTITNNGPAINGWTVNWTFPGTQSIYELWNGVVTQTGANVTVRNASYNASIPTGGRVSFGFNANWSGSNPLPTSFTLNGQTCGGATPAIVTSVTTLSVNEGGSAQFGVRLSAAPASNVTVNVARLSGDTDLTVSGGATLTFTPANFGTFQMVTIAAAEDADQTNGAAVFRASATGFNNADVTVNESDNDNAPLAILTNVTTLNVNEGSNAQFNVRLSSQPANNVTVNVARVSGDTDLTVSAGATLTFTTVNWNTPQNVTISAAEDADLTNGTALFRASATGLTSADVNVSEVDNDFAQIAIVTSVTTLSVNEGSNAQFGVRLASAPASNVTVNVARLSGDTDLTVSGGATLTFTPANFGTFQNVTISAAEDADQTNGTAVFRASGTGLINADVTVSEIDNDVPIPILTNLTRTLAVIENTNAQFGVRLSRAPAANVTVNVARLSGDTNLTVSGATTLTFTPANFSVLQMVTINAAEDADITNGTAVFRLSGTGLVNADVNVSEFDNDGAPVAERTFLAIFNGASEIPPVITPATGTATAILSPDETAALVTVNFSGLTSPQTAGHIHGPADPGQNASVILDLDNPLGPVTNFLWVFAPIGGLTVQAQVTALKTGRLYAQVHTANFPTGEIRGWLNPIVDPGDPDPEPGGGGFADVARFLEQATFGPTVTEINRVLGLPGIFEARLDAWLTEQFNAPTSNYANLVQLQQGTFVNYPVKLRFFQNAMRNPDQLRQRVAFALSQIVVAADVGNQDGNGDPTAMVAQYHDILTRNAFGNYRTLLREMSVSPIMGTYLTLVNSKQANPTTGAQPDENYIRELWQLFSVGTFRLNPDGSIQLDPQGRPRETYTIAEIQEGARALTGWKYAARAGQPDLAENPFNPFASMVPQEANHDTGSKVLLDGGITPAGRTTTQDLDFVIDNAFNHPNVGPFIGRQLIQHLVTSNPSPAYVARITAVFNNNGQGVRGDLRAVVRAILLDQEARGNSKTDLAYGKLREPALFLTNLFRALNCTGGMWGIPQRSRNMGQNVFSAPSVFNFYQPDFRVVINGQGILAPPAQLLTTSTIIQRCNLLHDFLFSNIQSGGDPNPAGSDTTTVVFNFAPWDQLASNPAALVDALNETLMHNSMSSAMRQTVINAVTSISNNNRLRVQTAIYIIASSMQYQVQR
jgi:uncharacterized protein (DUF1800 family)